MPDICNSRSIILINVTHQFFASTLIITALLVGCSHERSGVSPGRGEHDREDAEQGGSHQGEAGEESGTELTLNQTYDQVRNGARLVLTYDAPSNSYIGTVENTPDKTLMLDRIEVHLSNGTRPRPRPLTLLPVNKGRSLLRPRTTILKNGTPILNSTAANMSRGRNTVSMTASTVSPSNPK